MAGFRLATLGALFGLLALMPGTMAAEKEGNKSKVRKPDRPARIVPLGQMVKLTFALKGSPVPGITVYCATETYSAQLNFDGKDGYVNIDVSGRLMKSKSGKYLLMTYQAMVDFENGDGSGHASSSGSVLVRIGSEAKLLQLAGKDLTVRTQAVEPF